LNQSKNIIRKNAEGQYNYFVFQDTPLRSFCSFTQKFSKNRYRIKKI